MAVKTVEIDSLINGQLYGFRMFPRNLKGQYQTRDDKGTATATPVAFQLPTYTGQHAIFGDINEGRIEMYGSGTLTLSKGIYDMFAVGGGGDGNKDGGGGSGYTKEIYNILTNGNIIVSIGSSGGKTSIGSFLIVDQGNYPIGYSEFVTHSGGSGGGSGYAQAGRRAGDGGSDGSDGSKGESWNVNATYKGQGTTTRCSFNNILYAGGGGGGARYDGIPGKGGAGGGGDGGGGRNDYYQVATSGTPNTGSGGGGNYDSGMSGGSGIAIIRWKRN